MPSSAGAPSLRWAMPDCVSRDGIAALGRRMRDGEITAAAVTRAYLDRIEKLDPVIQAYEHVSWRDAMTAAEQVDRMLALGVDLGPLMGIPVAVKDNIVVDGMPTTGGTKVDIADLLPGEGSFVGRLRRAGAVILGKTRTVEFALGITGASVPRGTPRNPSDATRFLVPGGSSSGSAAAVAAGLCALGVGTDTGGSVRVPAALCGCVGIKTSTRRWGLDGVLPLAPHLDTIGLIGWTLDDVALAYCALEGETPPTAAAISRLRFGKPTDGFYSGLDQVVEARVDDALQRLAQAGAEVVPIAVPEASGRLDYFSTVLPASLIALLGRDRFVAQRHLMNPLVATRGDHGLDVTVSELAKVEGIRSRHREAAHAWFDGIDAWLTPTTTVVAPTMQDIEDPDRNWALAFGMTQNSQPINYLDLAAVTLPIGGSVVSQVGLQVVVPHGKERAAISMAIAIENIIPHRS